MGETGDRLAREKNRKHVSTKDKSAAVLRVLKGEDPVAVAEEIGVSDSRLARWNAAFLAGGMRGLEENSERHKGQGRVGDGLKSMWIWVLFLLVLVAVILVLQRFLNRADD